MFQQNNYITINGFFSFQKYKLLALNIYLFLQLNENGKNLSDKKWQLVNSITLYPIQLVVKYVMYLRCLSSKLHPFVINANSSHLC